MNLSQRMSPSEHSRVLQAYFIVRRCSFDLTARLWDSVTGDCLRVFTDHTKYVYSISFSPDGSQLVTGGGDGHLFMYDVKVSMLSPTMI